MTKISPFEIKQDEDGNEFYVNNTLYQTYVQTKKYELFLAKSNIPEFYHKISFDDYIGNKSSEGYKKIRYYAENCHKKEFNHIHLYLWGERGHQKCLTKDTLILTDSGFQYINNFSNNTSGFIEKNVSLLSKEGMIISSHFFEETVNETIKVELQNGIEIEGTPEHPLYIINNDLSFSFKPLKDITTDDYVIIKKDTNIFNRNKIKIDFEFRNGNTTRSKKLKNIPEYLDSNLSRFLGYYIANGNSSNGSLTVSTKNVKIKEDLNSIVSSFGLNLNFSKKDIICNRINSVQFKALIYQLLDIDLNSKYTARYKFVPSCILQGTKQNQIDFLRALIDCDSYYALNSSRLGYFTASERLAREVQLLLLNLGIYSNLYKDYDKKYNHTYWELWISGCEVEKYFNLIQYSLKYEYKEKKVGFKLNYSIPYLMDYTRKEVKKIRGILKVNKGGFFKFNNKNYTFSMRKLYNRSRNTKDITIEALAENYNQLIDFLKYDQQDIIKNLIIIYETLLNNKDQVYIKVKSKIINSTTKQVYDFTVPVYHNFYSNGMISHNTALLCNIGKQAIKNGLKVKFILAGDLIDLALKVQGYNNDVDLYNQLEDLKNNYDMLLIDDIGDIKKALSWEKESSHNLISTEWDRFFRKTLYNGTKLVMTSNFQIDTIKQSLSENIYALLERNTEKIHLTDSVSVQRKLNVESVFNK